MYIHKSSNHPPAIKKQLPKMIEDRLSRLSSNEEIFNSEKGLYEDALKIAGYSETLKYKKIDNIAPKQNSGRVRKRNILWFNPPFNMAVKTNVGRAFLCLINKHFPKSSPLHKYFNRSNVKVSYSCMPNISSIIPAIIIRLLGPRRL